MLSIFIAFVFSGCATVKPYYADETKNISIKNYSLNKTMQSYVGDTVVDVSDYRLKDSRQMELLTSFKIGNTHFTSGERFSVYGVMEVNKADYKVLSIRGYSPSLLVGKDNRLLNQIYDPMVWSFPYEVTIEPQVVEFKTIEIVTSADNALNARYQLLYNGANDVSFFLSYREFNADNIARAAFYQDLTYNKNQKTIRFRNLAIDVEKVDNEKIVYKVMQD